MKKYLYMMPVLALSLAALSLSACDDKQEGAAPADTAMESSMPVATEAAAPAETEANTAEQQAESTIAVSDAHSYATAPSATAGAIFATLTNSSDKPDFLLSATTDVAGNVEIHQTAQDPQTGATLMRKTSGVDIPANGEVKLAPDSYHIMLLNLAAPLTGEQTFNVTLSFRNAGDVVVPVSVVTVGGEELNEDHSAHDHGAATASDATADAGMSEDAAESAPAEEAPADEPAAQQ